MPGAGRGRNLRRHGEAARARALVPGGARLAFGAPGHGRPARAAAGRGSTADGAVERLTTGRHAIGAFDQVDGSGRGGAGGTRTVWLRSSPTELGDLWVRDGTAGAPRRLTDLNHDVLAEIELREPVERWVEVDGRRIQGWSCRPRPADRRARARRGPARHRDPRRSPHALLLVAGLEFQLLAASGIGVYYSNPRGSEGYGRDFNEANLRDWGPGPMRDVLAASSRSSRTGSPTRTGSASPAARTAAT